LPNGARFLMMKSTRPVASPTPQIVLVQHWFEELERLVSSR